MGKIQYSNVIKQKQGDTNQYVLVIKGSSYSVYANGKRMGVAESTKRSDGVVAYYGWQESGETTCSFANTWIWEFPSALP